MESTNSEVLKFYKLDEPFGEFSNFYAAELEIDGKTWPTSEHYFQAQKFAGTNDEYVEKIRTSKKPGDSKRLGGSRSHKLRDDWEAVKYDVMVTALRAKYIQHVHLRKLLLSTGDRPIVEDTSDDYVWGCGRDGTGKNLLGKALEQVRSEIRKSEATA